jgi:lysyl-tRNA synthetase class 2
MKRRAALRDAVRAFFGVRGYLEIETPIAVVCPGTEVHLRYFRTAWRDHRGEEHELFLRSSPELHMKQALALGAGKVFQLAPCFRGGGELARWHHPEFTMLEWYETGISFDGFIASTEALLQETHGRLGSRLPLPKRLPRVTVAEAFERWVGVSLVDGDPELGRKGKAVGSLSAQPADDFETAFFKLLMERVEPGLAGIGGGVLLDYPPSQAALATVRGGVAKRFEIYLPSPVNGNAKGSANGTDGEAIELCNGFEELLEERANRARVGEALARRKSLGYEAPAEDQDFYGALAGGLPPCCGNALGFDRWLALLSGEAGLDRVVPFRRAAPYGAYLE